MKAPALMLGGTRSFLLSDMKVALEEGEIPVDDDPDWSEDRSDTDCEASPVLSLICWRCFICVLVACFRFPFGLALSWHALRIVTR